MVKCRNLKCGNLIEYHEGYIKYDSRNFCGMKCLIQQLILEDEVIIIDNNGFEAYVHDGILYDTIEELEYYLDLYITYEGLY